MILSALLAIIEAFAIGIGAAILYVLILKKVKNNDQIMLLLVAFLLGLIGISEHIGVSELFSNNGFWSCYC